MRVALVTGASSGIGRETTLELGGMGFHVLAAGRSRSRTMPVVNEIIDRGGSAEYVTLDLASLAATEEAARSMVESGTGVDVLVNNAGVGLARGMTQDGFEIHLGVNHLGHFLLTLSLVPVLAANARVVTVASAAHRRVKGLDPSDMLGPTRSLLGWREYSQSKLANILFSRELARRQPGLKTYAVHPGLVATPLIPVWARPFAGRMLTPAEGAGPVVRCAVSAETAGETGLYYSRHRAEEPSDAARDDGLAAELWERSLAWCRPEPRG